MELLQDTLISICKKNILTSKVCVAGCPSARGGSTTATEDNTRYKAEN